MLTPEATEQLEEYFSTLVRRAYEQWGWRPESPYEQSNLCGYRATDLQNRHKKGRKVAQARTWIAQELRRTVGQKYHPTINFCGEIVLIWYDSRPVHWEDWADQGWQPLSFPNIALVMRCWTKKVYGKIVPIHTSAMLACKRKVEWPND